MENQSDISPITVNDVHNEINLDSTPNIGVSKTSLEFQQPLTQPETLGGSAKKKESQPITNDQRNESTLSDNISNNNDIQHRPKL